MVSERYLIDTHCWLWWHIIPKKLSRKVFHLIESGSTEIFFSVVSAWEISIKHGIKKLKLPLPPKKYIPTRLEKSYMEVLTIQLEHTLKIEELPAHHNDPFDRLLIAQAISENLTVMTCDKQFDLYDVKTTF